MAKDQIKESIYTQLFPEPSKSEKRIIQIIEAAIANYATIGVDKTTHEKIAKTCEISRPLIKHYFDDLDSLFEMVVKYIRASYQQYVIDAMEGFTSANDILSAYVTSAIEWGIEYPHHMRTWYLFFYRCTFESKFKKTNTELSQMGSKRIQEMFKLGQSQGVFGPIEDSNLSSKKIQALITGTITLLSTEEFNSRESKKLIENCVNDCLAIANWRP